MRLVIGWESPTTDWLHEAATSGGSSPLDFAVLGVAFLRDGARALRYRFRKRRDWWIVKQVDDDEPLATLHPDRAIAAKIAERELQDVVVAGGRYLPYGG